MKIGLKTFLVVGLMVVIAALLAACSGTTSVASKTATVAKEVGNGSFKVSDLAVNPSVVNAGVQSLIAAKITNNGSQDETYQGNIKIVSTNSASLPAYLPSDQVKIKAGTTQLLSVATTINNPGTYQIFWDDASQRLVVNPADIAPVAGLQLNDPSPAPGFSGVDVVTGKKVTLNQFSGSIVLLNFVNYGCNPAINQKVGIQLDAIKQAQQRGLSFVPLSIFCGCCPRDVLRQFAQDSGYNWPWILDTDYSIASKYAADVQQYGYPTLVFIDGSQFIRDVTGDANLADLTQEIGNIAQSQSN